MVSLQIISKILDKQDNSILENNGLTVDYFVGYEEEYNFIQEHLRQYNNIPDKATFLQRFPNVELVEVTESDKYLVDTVREEYLYYKSVPVVQKVAELLKSDANAAVEYMIASMKTLQPTYSDTGVDIVQQAIERYNKFLDVKSNHDNWFFTTGFEELDEVINGIKRVEELFVLFARTNQGKSWILEKICTHIWQLGFNVGYVSPEMSDLSVGYRFDTLYQNFSNSSLIWGKDDISNQDYKAYIDDLSKHTNKFIVGEPSKHFGNKVTVTKLKNFVKANDLHLLAIDGITYLSDERGNRNDNKTTSLTNISEDLMQLSIELNIPVLVVVQANRSGVIDKEENGTPELESIRDSDGISHNASTVLSIRQSNQGLEIGIKKQRFGKVGGKLLYDWNINTGTFTFIPCYDDEQPREETDRKVNEVKKSFNDKEDVF